MILEYIPLSSTCSALISEANVLCLGNFDGVHVGHRALLKEAIRLKKEQLSGALCGVFCFKTPPADYLMQDPPKHVCTTEQKLSCFREAGMDFAILADFPSVKDLSAEAFAQKVLVERCHAAAIVCGFNHRFGKDALGTPSLLREILPIPVSVVDAVCVDGITVSSSYVRKLLAKGDVSTAKALLTHPYRFTAKVEHGKAFGRTIGAPTMNQRFPKGLQMLRYGVYVTECRFDGKAYRGVTNVGTRPTVENGGSVNCETYLLNFEGTLYEKEVEISFLEFLRDEQKFDSPAALREQIERDVAKASYF